MSAVSAVTGSTSSPWAASLWSALQRGAVSGVSSIKPVSGGAGNGASANQPSATGGSSDWASVSGYGAQLASGSGNASLLQRAAQLGSATVDAASQFLTNITQSVFGSAAGGLQIGIDSAQLTSSAGVSSTSGSSTSGNSTSGTGSQSWSTTTAQASSDLVATGTLVTSDGQRFNFEVEVQLQLTAQSSEATSTTHGALATGSDASPLNVTVATPTSSADAANANTASVATTGNSAPSDVVFQGSLKQLLSMLHNGQFTQPLSNASAQAGTLTFNLLNQVPSATGYNA